MQLVRSDCKHCFLIHVNVTNIQIRLFNMMCSSVETFLSYSIRQLSKKSVEKIPQGVWGPDGGVSSSVSPTTVRSNQSLMSSPCCTSATRSKVSMGDGGWSRMLGLHSIWLWRSSIKANRPPCSTPRRGIPVVLSRKSSRRPLPALAQCCFSSVVSTSLSSSDCIIRAGCALSQLGAMDGDKAGEFGKRQSTDRSGAGVDLVGISVSKRSLC